MFEVTSLCGQICLGKQGENLARMVYFDEPATWKETFGEGKCELLHQRNGDEAPYPVVLDTEDGRVCWKITSSDTAIVGEGKCELHYSVDGVIVKSKIWKTSVLESLGGEIAEPPAPYQGWVDEVLGAAERIETEGQKLNEETRQLKEEVEKAETERVKAEEIRQENEQKRIEETNEAIQNANTAVSNVHSSIEAAIGAANAAYGATDTAYNAATTAFDAATDAKEATERVTQAIIEANDAAKNANDAASGINDKFANALKSSAKGEIVGITDISPIVHNVAVKASSKNLLPYPYVSKTLTTQGVTFTDNGDGSVTVNGTCGSTSTAGFTCHSATNNSCIPITFENGRQYTIACESADGIAFYLQYKKADGTNVWINTFSGSKTFTWSSEYTYMNMFIQVSVNKTVTNLTCHPIIVEGSTYNGVWTPYVPDVSAANVKTCGKNICDYTKFVGISVVDKANVILDGDTFIFPAGNKYYGITMTDGLPLIKGQPYKFSYEAVTTYGYPEAQINFTDGTKVIANNGKTVTIEKDIKSIHFYIFNGQLAETELRLSKFQVEAGTAVTEYEYPKQPTSYPIAADGTAEGVTSIYPNMTITTDTNGIVIDTEYNRDINKAFAELQQALISLGGNI